MPKKRKDGDYFTFEVMGRGKFPMDMLRYDNCWPATQDDVTKLVESMTNPDYLRMDWKITLRTRTLNTPTLGRWISFEWHVLQTTQKVIEASR